MKDSPAASSENLITESECGAVLPMRTAVNVNDERVLRTGCEIDRLNEESFDLVFIVVADEVEGFHLAEGLAAQDSFVQIGELLGRIAAAEEKFVHVAWT